MKWEKQEQEGWRTYEQTCAAVFRIVWSTLAGAGIERDRIEGIKPTVRPLFDKHFEEIDLDENIEDIKIVFFAELKDRLLGFGFTEQVIDNVIFAVDNQLDYEYGEADGNK